MNDIVFTLKSGKHAGVTLKTINTFSGNSVQVIELDKKDEAHRSGMRKDMIVKAVNTIPVRSAQDVTKIISATKQYEGVVIFTMKTMNKNRWFDKVKEKMGMRTKRIVVVPNV